MSSRVRSASRFAPLIASRVASSLHTKRPSPCAYGNTRSAGSSNPASSRVHTHGLDGFTSIPAQSSRKRPFAFSHSATQGSSLNPGSNPSCTSTWNPLQIPMISAPRAAAAFSSGSSRSRTYIALIRPEATSSPYENPPGNPIRSYDESRSGSPPITSKCTLSALAPASSNARNSSASQFVPAVRITNARGVLMELW